MLKRFIVLKKTRCLIVTLLNKYAYIALASLTVCQAVDAQTLLPSQQDKYKRIT
jgi:hypothetical protein